MGKGPSSSPPSERSNKKRRKERVLARSFLTPDQWKTFKTCTFTYTFSRIVRYEFFNVMAKLADAADLNPQVRKDCGGSILAAGTKGH